MEMKGICNEFEYLSVYLDVDTVGRASPPQFTKQNVTQVGKNQRVSG